MPTIGAPLRKWTLYLLLVCSLPLCACALSTNETATVTASRFASSSVDAKGSATTTSLSASSLPAFLDSACPFRTINHITHTLPQQCLRTDWASPAVDSSVYGAGEAGPTLAPEGLPGLREVVVEREGGIEGTYHSKQPLENVRPEETNTPSASTPSDATGTQLDTEFETDSPFDNADFLSFEEWKQKNLAQVGQSPENVGQGRASSSEQRTRRRPVNVNALDSLGEEGEIEIDFSGFGTPPEGVSESGNPSASPNALDTGDATAAVEAEGKAAPSSWALSKDAGKTCKERFNYASFDCAATVLKTNPKAKSTSSILVENKDSYMLNECSADNKFLVVELCDDILVDTIVLANYEFFSSMFRHVRVSVSDRYPVKMDRWRVLGTFEARNSRDIQPFLITEPQIWARYLRIEFLTHYGNEFYCPMSLLRVHGTTMMEQFRREEEQARGDDDFAEPIEVEQGVPVQTAVLLEDDSSVVQTVVQLKEILSDVASQAVDTPTTPEPTEGLDHASDMGKLHAPPKTVSTQSPEVDPSLSAKSRIKVAPRSEQPTQSLVPSNSNKSESAKEPGTTHTTVKDAAASSSVSTNASLPAHSPPAEAKSNIPTSVSKSRGSKGSTNETAIASSSSSVKAASSSTNNSSQVQPQVRGPSQTQPVAATPTTQESFFKSIHKRLQYLEANSTLSLQYIEEQSRILRDAFIKVEKNQLQKTEKFLNHLNSTVMQELKSYRNMYDQLWQSTILELEGMKERQKTEMGEIGARLSMVADELVWQKRMAVVQSTLLLLCLGLVLFVRSGSLGSQLGNTYSNLFEMPERVPQNAGLLRRRRTFKNMWRSDTSAAQSDRSGHLSDTGNMVSDGETDARSPVNVEFSPPTPITPDVPNSAHKKVGFFPEQPYNSTYEDQDAGLATPIEETFDDEAQRIEVLETQSGPATPRGSRDNRPSWEEVDRAVGLLKAGGQGQGMQNGRASREKRKRRSPLRRAESYDGVTSDSPEDDGAEGLFVAG
jgi:hypothetical protein